MKDFYKGMDISFVPQCVDEGMVIKDFDGTEMNPVEIAQKYGVNSIRLRIWNNPENVPEAKGYCSLEQTIAMARQVKKYGMSFMLDFHYSDHWADPGQQRKPKAWEHLSFEELKEAMYNYTKDTLMAFKKEGLLPDIVQIGNEIRSGFLFPEGEVPNWDGLVGLINAGIMGARAVADSEEMKVMIHLDQGGRYFYIKEWFDQALAHGMLDYDIMGLSYYAFWHGTFSDIKNSMENLIQDYQKPIMVVESAYAWRRSQKGFIDDEQIRIAGIPATPAGQKEAIDLIMNIVASLPNNMGRGVYYWEPLCIPREGDDGWSENMGILDESGRVMDCIESFLFTREDATPDKIARVYQPQPLTICKGELPQFPDTVDILYYDGTIKKHSVHWDKNVPNSVDKWSDVPGIYSFVGKIDTVPLDVLIEITVKEKLDYFDNLVINEDWSEGWKNWIIEKSDDRVEVILESKEKYENEKYLKLSSPMNFIFSIHQEIPIKETGNYTLQVEYQGTDTTNVDVKLYLKTQGECYEQVIHPSNQDWQRYEINHVECIAGTIELGVKISSPPIYGMIRKFIFIKEK